MLFEWYLFVIIFGVYAFSKVGAQTYKIYVAGEWETRVMWFPVLVMIAVLTYVAAARNESFLDTRSYVLHYLRTGTTWEDVLSVLRGAEKDKGFYAVTIVLKALIGNHYKIYFAVIAGFCMCCVLPVYKKHSSNFFMSLFLFLASGEYVQWTHNGMRQFIAVSMCFAATGLLLKKKAVPYFLVVLLASTFHATALVMIPVYFLVQGKPWNSKTVLFMLAVMVGISSVDALTGALTMLMESTQYANDVDALLSTDGTNYLRVLVYAIPPLMSLMFRRRLVQADVPIINLAANMSIASIGAYLVSMVTSGIYIGRMPIYFSLYNYILLPWVIDRVFEKRSARLIYLAVMGCYMIFYYYQMHIVWGSVTAL